MKHIIRDLCFLAAIALVAAMELDGQPAGPRPIPGGTFETSGAMCVPGMNAVPVDGDQRAQ